MKKRTILILLGILLVVLQFFQIDKTNPSIEDQKDFIKTTTPPAQIAGLIKTACYDCHSHTTKYPWYTNLQPVAWWVKGHIDNGRKHLNFSTWTDYDQDKKEHKLEECIEVLEEKEMPILPYMVAHQEAWIDDEQRAALAEWFKRQKEMRSAIGEKW